MSKLHKPHLSGRPPLLLDVDILISSPKLQAEPPKTDRLEQSAALNLIRAIHGAESVGVLTTSQAQEMLDFLPGGLVVPVKDR
jgi:hypothetical protein